MVDSQNSPPARSKPWMLSFGCAIAMVAVWFLPMASASLGKITFPDWVRFIGHFHPVMLHLPIGVFILIVTQELLLIFRKPTENSGSGGVFPFIFGALSAAAAALTGMLLYLGSGDDYRGNLVAERHMWLGIAFTSGSFLTLLLKAWASALSANPAFYRTALFLSVAGMSMAGHDGGTMTHGEGFLTRYAPEPLRRLLGIQEDEKKDPPPTSSKDEVVVYQNVIAPILERRCVQCHKQEKSKGRLRMDTYELLLKGGKEGPALVKGDAANSLMIQRIELPTDDEEHMPPEGKPDMTQDELLVLKWWINAGADSQALLSSLKVPAELQKTIEQLSHQQPAAEVDEKKQSPSSEKSLLEMARAELAPEMEAFAKDFPGALLFESQNSPALTLTAVSYRQAFDDAVLARLKPFLPHLVSVDLSSANISDRGIAIFDETASSLTVLKLAQTAVSDASMVGISKLPSLQSLNLFGTTISDVGVSHLTSMPSLKNLYLGETSVSADKIKELREKMPNCHVHGGIE